MRKYIVFALLAILFLGVFLFFQTTYFRSRASVIAKFSPDNSYIFATPLTAQANGLERIRITAFILSGEGNPVSGNKVSISTSSYLFIEPIQGTSDSLGKAIYDISSRQPGQYYLEVKVEGVSLPQKIQITFN